MKNFIETETTRGWRDDFLSIIKCRKCFKRFFYDEYMIMYTICYVKVQKEKTRLLLINDQ